MKRLSCLDSSVGEVGVWVGAFLLMAHEHGVTTPVLLKNRRGSPAIVGPTAPGASGRRVPEGVSRKPAGLVGFLKR
jgi:hypothetical protein